MKMPFGKYQDIELAEIPSQYLRWLGRQPWVGRWLIQGIDGVLFERYGQKDQLIEKIVKEYNVDDDEGCF
jgi:hypothetical protein